MKHIKAFELVRTHYVIKNKQEHLDGPNVGDYVYCAVPDYSDVQDIIKDQIGVVRNNLREDEEGYYVEYTVPYYLFLDYDIFDTTHLTSDGYPRLLDVNGEKAFYQGLLPIMKDEVLHWSKDKNDIQIYIDANKYNL